MLMPTCLICLPLNSHKIEVAKERFDHLKEIKLADSSRCNLDLKVNINFIFDLFVRGDSGPIALLTKVGYVLSVPNDEVTNNIHSNLISSYLIKIQSNFLSENENLQSAMKIFWANETRNFRN